MSYRFLLAQLWQSVEKGCVIANASIHVQSLFLTWEMTLLPGEKLYSHGTKYRPVKLHSAFYQCPLSASAVLLVQATFILAHVLITAMLATHSWCDAEWHLGREAHDWCKCVTHNCIYFIWTKLKQNSTEPCQGSLLCSTKWQMTKWAFPPVQAILSYSVNNGL